MDFDLSADQRLLQRSARDYLARRAPLAVAREVLETPAPHHTALWRGVAEMGWPGTAVPAEYGGTGAGHLELALVAEELGRVLAPIPFASSVYLATEALLVAGTAEQRRRYLPRLASGELIGTLALAESAGEPGAADVHTTFAGGRLQGTKVPVSDGETAGLAVVVARTRRDEIALVLTELDAAGVERHSHRSLDPSRSQAALVFAGVPGERLGAPGDGWTRLGEILDRAAVLMAFEQLGGAERAFDLTREYILGRYAFGRPIASFQAVKHRLADLWAAIELARANCHFAAWALDAESVERDVAACAARVSATEAFELAAREMIQLHGGVGFTWEFDCHLFYRRSKLLALALGSASCWREKLVARLERQRAA